MKALIIGDTHFPWVRHDYLNQTLDRADRMQPHYIFQMGDLYDFYSFSRYARSLDLITPKQEIADGRGEAEAFWAAMRMAAPKAKLVQLLGNHDERLMKQVGARFPELAAVLEYLDYLQLWRFEGVELGQQSQSDEYIVEDFFRDEEPVCFQHGHYSKIGDHARFNQMNTVVGHSHKGGTEFFPLRDRVLWELNAGYVADKAMKPLQYTQSKQLIRSVPGLGIIDNDGPRFIPF